VWLPGWPGVPVHGAVAFRPVPPGAPSGTQVGVAAYAVGVERQTVPAVLSDTVPEPDWWWRLLHGR
jgi:hypothetical protein